MRAKKDAKAEEVFSAVIVADSFTDDFKPISYECPRTLMPLGGVALLDYAIELLAMNGVEEVFVVTVAHGEKIEEHLNKRWIGETEMQVQTVNMPGCICHADAIRRLHNLQLLRYDFLLISGDVISNLANLRELWSVHCRKRENDGSVLMTLLLKEQTLPLLRSRESIMKASMANLSTANDSPLARTVTEATSVESREHERVTASIPHALGLLGEGRGTAVYDSSTMNLLQYHVWGGALTAPKDEDASDDGDEGKKKENVELDLNLFANNNTATLRVRTDLVETGMAFCSVALLEMFEVNGVDFKDMHDCINSVINEELLGNKIIIDILPSARFLRRVRTVEQYIEVSKAVLGGWTYPLVPDASFASSYHCVTTQDTNVYIDRTTQLTHTSSIGRCTLLGPDVSVGERCSVAFSVLNAKVVLGAGTTVRHSHIWENVTVGEGCSIDGALVCSGVTIGDGCTIGVGSVISFGVKLAPGTTVQARTRITRVARKEGGDGEGSDVDWDEDEDLEVEFIDDGEVAVVGEGGVGRQFTFDTEMKLDAYKLALPQDEDDSVSNVSGVFADEDDSDFESETMVSPEEKFFAEVMDIIKTAVAEQKEIDGTLLMVNDTKLCYEMTTCDAVKAVLEGFLSVATDAGDSSKACVKAFLTTTKKWRKLLQKYAEDELEMPMLQTVLTYAKEHKQVEARVGNYLHGLYDLDFLSDDTILRWERRMLNQQKKGSLAEDDARMLSGCQDLLDMLKESDSSGDDDSSSSS